MRWPIFDNIIFDYNIYDPKITLVTPTTALTSSGDSFSVEFYNPNIVIVVSTDVIEPSDEKVTITLS